MSSLRVGRDFFQLEFPSNAHRRIVNSTVEGVDKTLFPLYHKKCLPPPTMATPTHILFFRWVLLHPPCYLKIILCGEESGSHSSEGRSWTISNRETKRTGSTCDCWWLCRWWCWCLENLDWGAQERKSKFSVKPN
jgi:hypothetical protein